MIKCSTIKIDFFLFSLFSLSSLLSTAQVVRKFRQHEVIEVGNGMKIEILGCRGEGTNEECNVIYYTDRRQLGTRKWETVFKIAEQEQAERQARYKRVVDSLLVIRKTSSKANNLKADKVIKQLPANDIIKAEITPPIPNVANGAQTQIKEQPVKVAVQKALPDSADHIADNKTKALNKKSGVGAIAPTAKITAATKYRKDSSIIDSPAITSNVRTTGEVLKKQEDTVVGIKKSEVSPDAAKSTGEGGEKKINSKAALYTLDQCYQLALERNPGIKRAKNNINGGIIDRKTAQYGILPSLSYGMGHYITFGKNIDPVTNSFSYESFSGGYAGVGLQLQLFSGFNRINTIKQSAYNLEAFNYAKKRTEIELLSEVTLTYASLLAAKEEANLERNNFQTTLKQIEIINEKIRLGKVTKYEGYTFNGRLNTQKSNIIIIENDSSAAVQSLKQLMSLDYKDQFDIAAIDSAVLNNIYNTNIPVNEFIETVLQKHPAIKEAEMAAQAARIGEKIAKSANYPSLSVGGNVSSNYNIDQTGPTGQKIALGEQINSNLGQNISIGLNIPIFSQMQNLSRIRKERINISNADLAKQEAKNAIVTNTLQIVNDFNANKQSYMASLIAYEQNVLSYSLYEEKHRLGLISSVEALAARDILNASASKYITTKLQLYFQFRLIELLKAL